LKAIAWVDGSLIPPEEARVPLEDRGFLFGESAYEAMLVRNGRAFSLELHLSRLERSAEGARIVPARFMNRVRDAVKALLQASEGGDALLYLQVTGGSGPREHLPAGDGHSPGVYGTLRPFDHVVLRENQRRGLRAILRQDRRWPNATWKTTQLLGNLLGKREAAAAGAEEVLLHDADGALLEGGSTSLFVVCGGVAITTPTTRNILPGITRSLLLEHASDRVREADIDIRFLAASDEVFVASTTRPVMGVIEIDGRKVGNGKPGPVTQELARRFGELMAAAWGE